MDLGPFLIETHLRTGRPIAELARTHDVHRSWLYKLLKRYRLEGPSGLEARSRRPHRSPTRRERDHYEDEIVTLRKDLLDFGVDAGAETIRYHLQRRHAEVVPSCSTIWRVLKDRGFVTPQPQKRPKSSLRRFSADLPNETLAGRRNPCSGRRSSEALISGELGIPWSGLLLPIPNPYSLFPVPCH